MSCKVTFSYFHFTICGLCLQTVARRCRPALGNPQAQHVTFSFSLRQSICFHEIFLEVFHLVPCLVFPSRSWSCMITVTHEFSSESIEITRLSFLTTIHFTFVLASLRLKDPREWIRMKYFERSWDYIVMKTTEDLLENGKPEKMDRLVSLHAGLTFYLYWY